MSKEAVIEAPAPQPVHSGSLLPKPVIGICVLLIAVGAIVISARPKMLKSNAFEALQHCEATVFRPNNAERKAQTDDGLNELYGVIHIKQDKPELSHYFSYCETDPELALEVYRRAMKEGNLSAKTIAAYSSFFLASRGVFEASDFDLLRKCLQKGELKDNKDPNVDLRKVAQRALSDLTVIKNVKDASRYEELPPNLPPRGSEEKSRAIKTRTEQLGGQDVLYVRWSSAEVAEGWWTANGSKGAWDPKLKRFVIP